MSTYNTTIEFRPIPYLSGYTISENGIIKNNKNVIIGNYYGITHNGKFYSINSILMNVWGHCDRELKNTSYLEKKKKIVNIISDKEIEKQQIQDTLNYWYMVSGETSHFELYFSEIFGRTIDEMIDIANQYLVCNSCVELVEYDNLVINWGGYQTSEFLSLTIFKYLMKRVEDGNEHFAASYKLYPDEYKLYAKILHVLFKEVVRDSFGFDEDDMKEISIAKELMTIDIETNSNDEDDGMMENIPIEYGKMHHYDTDKGCDEFVYKYVDTTLRSTKRTERPEITKKEFNERFRNVLRDNNNRFSISSLFVHFTEYYYVELFAGFRRLDHDIQKIIIKEITHDR